MKQARALSRTITRLPAGLVEDVRIGLTDPTQKWLSSKYLYDAVGSSLFEAITHLDAYGLTRADARLLREHAGAIARRAGSPGLVAELGSGSGRKVRWLLEAVAEGGGITYCPIDISRRAIVFCRAELGRVPGVRFRGIVADYLVGLQRAVAQRSRGGRVLVLFVGSTIGNFEREPAVRFLQDVRRILAAGDRLLLGADLVKSEAQLIEAYDDPAGVTAAFNLNLLSRLNRELGANFDLSRFRHEARWNRRERRIEMHLRSTVAQVVRVPEAGIEARFRAGETLWTESSHKFLAEEPAALAAAAGFRSTEQWIDDEWPFAETLLEAR